MSSSSSLDKVLRMQLDCNEPFDKAFADSLNATTDEKISALHRLFEEKKGEGKSSWGLKAILNLSKSLISKTPELGVTQETHDAAELDSFQRWVKLIPFAEPLHSAIGARWNFRCLTDEKKLVFSLYTQQSMRLSAPWARNEGQFYGQSAALVEHLKKIQNNWEILSEVYLLINDGVVTGIYDNSRVAHLKLQELLRYGGPHLPQLWPLGRTAERLLEMQFKKWVGFLPCSHEIVDKIRIKYVTAFENDKATLKYSFEPLLADAKEQETFLNLSYYCPGPEHLTNESTCAMLKIASDWQPTTLAAYLAISDGLIIFMTNKEDELKKFLANSRKVCTSFILQ